MARIFIDLTEDEVMWNGNIAVRMLDQDSLSGKDCALAIGDHEIILSVPQAVTLFDTLDAWLNGGPIREVGGIERRILEALKEAAQEFTPAVRAAVTRSPESVARMLYFHLKMKGLRFRLTGDELDENDSLRRRHEQWRKRLEARAGEGEAP